jgi:Beta-lactamase enzyme family
MSRPDRLALSRALVVTLVLGCGQQVGAQSVVQAPVAPAVDPRATSATVLPAPAQAPARAEAPPPSAAAPSPAAATPAGRDALMDKLLGGGTAALKTVVATPEKYRFQVLYGVIGQGDKPTLERHAYRVDAEYFFPASSMKVPITLATYDRLAALHAKGITRDASLRIHPVSGAAEPYVTTLARETWRALIVSDNFSANRLLGFVGHREVHDTLWSLGLKSARIHSGFATGADIDPAELSPRIEVTVAGGGAIEIPARRSDLVLPPTDAASLAIGQATIVDGRRVAGPLSFADKNALRLRELQDTLVRIMRPELLPGAPTDPMSKEDLTYVRLALGTLPSESGLAGFERNVVADYQLSPFLRGIERVRARGHFQIFSKVGQAYGFLIGNAYVVDKDSGRAFFLTASVYANPDETMNDDTYAYDTISFPALADVGEAFCRHAFTP